MTLGPLMLDIEGTSLTPADRGLLRHPAVGGVIFFARNFESPAQLRELSTEIRSLRSPELLIAVDQEGGRVQRFQNELTRLPPMRQYGRIYDENPNAARVRLREAAWLLGAELAALGVDFSFTPVVDLDWGVSEVIGDRAFHSDPDVVAELAIAVVRGLRDAGMSACAKHFPGHGAVVADSHLDLPVDRRELSAILDDIRPYERLIREGLGAVMTAHVVYANCDPVPATFSSWWLAEYLRTRLRFKGAVFSDDLTMHATRGIGSVNECALKALHAGCDMVLVCNDRPAAEVAAEALADWIQPTSLVRQASLRCHPAVSLSDLRDSVRWREARDDLATFLQRPDLTLDA